MQYKTIVLELIKQRPNLHEQLRSNDSLISTMEQYASQLREKHLALVDELRQTRPGSAEAQLMSEAMEIAVQQIEQAFPHDSTESDESFLDEAMAYLRKHTPPG